MVSGAKPNRVRLVMLLYRKQGTSFEEFSNYWANEHSKLFSNLAVVKKNLLGYEQAHGSPDSVQKLSAVGFPCTDADGMAIFEAETSEQIWEIFQDEEYHKVVVPDEENFLDRARSVAFPAEIVSVISK